MIRAFIQARMTSTRFPGKVLAPLAGRPMIDHLIERLFEVLPSSSVHLATSTHRTDDPLACYVASLGVDVFRGPLEDVFARFRLCLAAHPCDGFLRVCADSPLLEPAVVRRVLAEAQAPDVDLVTTVFPRTFPQGQNVEFVRARTFERIPPESLDEADREHVTRCFYRNAERYRIINVESGHRGLARRRLGVDTLADHRRLERRLARREGGDTPRTEPPALGAALG